MKIDAPVLRELIIARINRTISYLERFRNSIPKFLIPLKHKFEHPISRLKILSKQLTGLPRTSYFPTDPLPEGGIPEDVNYFDMALNELKTALHYFQLRTENDLFFELADIYLEQKLLKLVTDLEALGKEISPASSAR